MVTKHEWRVVYIHCSCPPYCNERGSRKTTQTKRHSRLDITPGMISAPLGDFRHTLHVGRCGEAFGDTAFLRHSDASTEPQTETPSPSETSFDARGCTATYSAALAAARATAKIAAPRHHTTTTWTVETNPELTRATDNFDNSQSTMCRTDSLLSFHVDLGPSMMDDVLGVMEDVPKGPHACDGPTLNVNLKN
uniref:CDC42 effector protein 5 n=1 Tax=Eptatretus burgeri TaxID=7764 RepID=A0A8C4QMX2_EPTBU